MCQRHGRPNPRFRTRCKAAKFNNMPIKTNDERADKDLFWGADATRRPVVTIAAQRSGTKFLLASLRSGERFVPYGEVFNPQKKRNYAFLKYLDRKAITLFGQHRRELERTLDGYFKHLERKAPRGKRVHFDLMYNQIGGVNPILAYPGLKNDSFLLDYLKDRGFGILHIVREPLFEGYVSGRVARARGVHHTSNEDLSREELKLKINIEHMKKFTIGNLSARRAVRAALNGYAHGLEVGYPDFISGSNVAHDTYDFSTAFGETDGVFGESDTKKTTRLEYIDITNLEAARKIYQRIAARFGEIPKTL